MDISKLIDLKNKLSFDFDVIDFATARLKTGKHALRVTADRVFTEDEVNELKKYKNVVSAECVAEFANDSRVLRSYFYIEY